MFYSDMYWITRMVMSIVLGLGVPGIVAAGLLGWRRLSMRKKELEIQERQLNLEAERLQLERLELENRHLDRQLAELDRPVRQS